MDLKEKNVNMNFRLSKDLRDAMRARAEYLGINMSQFFRNAIENELGNTEPAIVDSKFKNIPQEVTKLVGFFCPIQLADDFDIVCKKQNIPKSLILRQFVANYIKEYYKKEK